MQMRVVALVLSLASIAGAQQPPCESACNVEGSACMKACTTDPKAAQPSGSGGQALMQCLKRCEAKTAECKQRCPRR